MPYAEKYVAESKVTQLLALFKDFPDSSGGLPENGLTYGQKKGYFTLIYLRAWKKRVLGAKPFDLRCCTHCRT